MINKIKKELSKNMLLYTLIALSVGIALDSPACILNNVKAAKKGGASKEEIMETFKVAKFSKSATTLSSSTMALEWLNNNC